MFVIRDICIQRIDTHKCIYLASIITVLIAKLVIIMSPTLPNKHLNMSPTFTALNICFSIMS